MKDDEQLIKVTFRLPAGLVKDMKHRAVDAGVSLQDLATQAIRAFLSRKGGR